MDFTRSSSSGHLASENMERAATASSVRSARSTNSLNSQTSSPSGSVSSASRSRPIPIQFGRSPVLGTGGLNAPIAMVSQSMPVKPRVGSLRPDSSFTLMPQLELPPVNRDAVDGNDGDSDINNMHRGVAASAPLRPRALSLSSSSNTQGVGVLHQMRIENPTTRDLRATSNSGMSASFKQVLSSLAEGPVGDEDGEHEEFAKDREEVSPGLSSSVILQSVLSSTSESAAVSATVSFDDGPMPPVIQFENSLNISVEDNDDQDYQFEME